MCWSVEVAAIFASLETVALIAMFLRTRGPFKDMAPPDTQHKDNMILPMLLTINVVEWSEVAVWLTEPENLNIERECNKVNKGFTMLAGCVVWLQPVFTMAFARWTGPEADRPMFTIPFVLSLLTAAGFYLRLVLGERGVADVASRDKMALAWPHTCSYDGDHGHLEWRFALAAIEVLPTMFSYHLFFNVALMFHDFPIGFVAGGGSLVTVAIEFASVQGSGEAWSIWCWSGCLFIGFYWVTNLIDLEAMRAPTVSMQPSTVTQRGPDDGVVTDDPEAGSVDVTCPGTIEGSSPLSCPDRDE